MVASVLTKRHLKKLEEFRYYICEFPSSGDGTQGVRFRVNDFFIAYSSVLEGTCIKNISTRLRDFCDFIRWCAGDVERTNKDIFEIRIKINEEHLREYENYLKDDRNNSQGSVWVKISHIRSIFRWAEENCYVNRSWKYKVRGKPFQKKENIVEKAIEEKEDIFSYNTSEISLQSIRDILKYS